MQNRTNPRRMYFFSQKLKNQLAQVSRHPLTVVEAPSGFGKTTAVREYLRENLRGGALDYWYTCLGEPGSAAWKGICSLLANVNSEIASTLTNLELPTVDSLMQIGNLLRNFECRIETYLVIDNFQLVDSDIPRELINVFSMHGNENLHFIFITQQLRSRQQYLIHNADICTIDSSAFFFDRDGTANLFRLEGIRLSEEELENVFMSTEGWVSAIRLQILNYKENGKFDHTADIEHLVEAAIWKRLSQEEQRFLLSVCVMDSFTVRQAAIMSESDILPDAIEYMLKSNDFIRYFPEKSTFTIHSILQDYLRSRFYHHQTLEFQNRIYRLTGRSYVAIGQYYLAAQFFLKVKDYDAILSLPLDGQYLGNQKENGILTFLSKVVENCPEETLIRYPDTMIAAAYNMLIDGRMESFQKLFRLIGNVIQDESSLDSQGRRRLEGEYAFIAAFTAFNSIPAMGQGFQRALQILGGPSSIVTGGMPWTFGGISVLSMFWSEPGKLEEQISSMDECLSAYQYLTRGHCAGVNSVIRAEAFLMRGEDEAAEVLCHKGLYEAKSQKQTSVCLCAEIVLAQIHILRGDAEGFFNTVKNLKAYIKDTANSYTVRLAELSISYLYLTLGMRENVAPWLYNIESIKEVLYAHTVPFALMLYSKILHMEKRYNEFFGISQFVMDAAGKPGRGERYLFSQLHQLLTMAMAKHQCGYGLEAQGHLKEALAIALADRVYLPFAQQEGLMDAMVDTALGFYAASGYTSAAETIKGSAQAADNQGSIIKDGVDLGFAAFKALCKRQEKGVAIIKKAVLQTKSSLTPREREIAHFAKERLSAKEIADKLYISEATVRTILRSVYSKLDVHSKSELNAKEF